MTLCICLLLPDIYFFNYHAQETEAPIYQVPTMCQALCRLDSHWIKKSLRVGTTAHPGLDIKLGRGSLNKTNWLSVDIVCISLK